MPSTGDLKFGSRGPGAGDLKFGFRDPGTGISSHALGHQKSEETVSLFGFFAV